MSDFILTLSFPASHGNRTNSTRSALRFVIISDIFMMKVYCSKPKFPQGTVCAVAISFDGLPNFATWYLNQNNLTLPVDQPGSHSMLSRPVDILAYDRAYY